MGLLDEVLDRDDSAAMADGDVTVTLDSETARRVQIIAAAVGRSVQGYVAELIADRFDSLAEAEAAFEEYERTGESVDAKAALSEFQDRVAARIKRV